MLCTRHPQVIATVILQICSMMHTGVTLIMLLPSDRNITCVGMTIQDGGKLDLRSHYGEPTDQYNIEVRLSYWVFCYRVHLLQPFVSWLPGPFPLAFCFLVTWSVTSGLLLPGPFTPAFCFLVTWSVSSGLVLLGPFTLAFCYRVHLC